MKYLLDTNICVEVLRDRNRGVVTTCQSRTPDELVICSVVRAELMYGALRSTQPAHNLQLVADIAAPLKTAAFDDVAADVYAGIRVDLERQGRPIGPNDTLIAAIALSGGLIVMTHNAAEFARVDGLNCEDWFA